MSRDHKAGRSDAVSTEREEARWEQVLMARADDAARQVAKVQQGTEAGQATGAAEVGARLRKRRSELAAAQRGLEEWRAR